MPLPVAAIIGAAAIGAVGGIIQGQQSAKAAEKQMKFQGYMSSTAYQRQMADLEAAGLNPMLASKLGGASTPGGAQPAYIPNIGALAANTALQAYQIDAGVDNTKQDTKLKAMTTEREFGALKQHSAMADYYHELRRSETLRQEGLQNEAILQRKLGPAVKAIPHASGIMKILKDLRNLPRALSGHTARALAGIGRGR